MRTELSPKSEIFVVIALVLLFMIVFMAADIEEQRALYEEKQEELTQEKERANDRELHWTGYFQRQRRDNPPIIILNEQEQRFRFQLGSARIPAYFAQSLIERIIPYLDSLSESYGCDAIEVVGHTDGVPISNSESNLDSDLAGAFSRGRVEGLTPGSNIDLGMMRALAIIQLFQQGQLAGWFESIEYFFPYSAGQMIKLDRTLTVIDSEENDLARRRIEIRLLNSKRRELKSL